MKASRAEIDRALKAPDQSRFFLFHGPDESGSRAFVQSLSALMGSEAERVDLNGSELKSDPARLCDEAASISLFGSARYIVVEAAGDDVLDAVEGLLSASTAGNPVAVIAGTLKPTSKLLKLALAAPNVLAFASYVPDGRDADRLVMEMGQSLNLTMSSDVARRIADAAGGNRAVIGQELEKFALYSDAGTDGRQAIGHDVIDAVGAASEEGDLSRLVDSVASGDNHALQAELLRLKSEGIEGIPLIRAVIRRMTVLARLRALVESGQSPSAVMASQGKAIFWKEKDSVGLQLSRWRSALIAKAISRLLDAERQVKSPGALGPIAVDEELFAICRQAARLR